MPSLPPHRPRNPRRARNPWPASFAASGAVHAGLIAGALALPTALWAGSRRAPSPPVVFTVELERPEPVVEPPEPERELEVAKLDEPPEVREVEVETQPPPDPEFAPVDLEPSPLDRVAVDAFQPRRPPPELPPVASPPAEAPPRAADEALVAEPTEPEPPDPPGAEAEDVAPRPLYFPKPPYPVRAQRCGWEGTVVCGLTVGVDGSVLRVWIERSSGHDVLDRAAVDGLGGWRFEPGTRGGRPIEMDVLRRFEFRLYGRP